MSILSYMDFVNELRDILLITTGYDKSRIYFKPENDYPPTSGDRLFVEFARQDENKEVFALQIADLYGAYQNGIPMQELTAQIMQSLQRIEDKNILPRIMQLSNYEKIKDSLLIRPLNYETHRNELQNAVYQINGDIALVLYVLVHESNEETMSFKVPKDLISKWNVDEYTVFQNALVSTYFLSPPRMYDFTQLIFNPDYAGDAFMDITKNFPIDTTPVGNCLSTTGKTNGAVAIFLPGVAQRIHHLFRNKNFYIVFTSIHEAMIHLEDSVTIEQLKHTLQNTINAATPEEDILTHSIYYYDGTVIKKI